MRNFIAGQPEFLRKEPTAKNAAILNGILEQSKNGREFVNAFSEVLAQFGNLEREGYQFAKAGREQDQIRHAMLRLVERDGGAERTVKEYVDQYWGQPF